MKVATIDNGIQGETNRCITWQYDNAEHIVGIINSLKDFFEQSTKNFWDDWKTNVIDIDSANDFGLSVWGKLLGCQRPVLNYGSPAADHILSTSLYRKLLKARFKLLGRNASLDSYCKYIDEIFDGKVTATDGFSMNITFAVGTGMTLTDEESALFASEVAFIYPSGVKDNSSGTGLKFGLEEDVVSSSYTHQYGGLGNSTFDWS